MFTKTAKAIVQEDIANLERITGYKLPQDFISQYITFNGGIPDKSLFCDTEDEEEGYEISFYLPIKYYSDDYLPFAVDWGGNYFAIDLRSGNIVLLFMDLGEFTEDCIEYLAESYNEFVGNLVKAED